MGVMGYHSDERLHRNQHIGPIAYRDVEWIEIDVSMISEKGRLNPRVDVVETLAQIKNDSDLFDFVGTRAHISVDSIA
jgi:hypothetical protein